MSLPPRARTHAVLVALIWLVVLVAALALPLHYRDDVHTANEESRVYAAVAMARFGTVALDPVFDEDSPGWRDRHVAPNMDLSTRDGRLLLDKAPATSWLAVPIVAAIPVRDYAWLTWILVLFLSALPSALATWFLWRWLARQGETPFVADVVALGMVIATPWMIYAGLFFGHALAASFVCVGVTSALGPLTTPDAGRTRPFLGGLALGLAVTTEYTTAIVVCAVCAGLALDGQRRRALVWVVLGGLGPLIALLAWNTVVFGGPLHVSYAYKAAAPLAKTHATGLFGISSPTWAGLWGILGGARRGLFFLSPGLIFAIPGLVLLVADRGVGRAWKIALPLALVGFVLAVAGFADWNGGRAIGPRYLVPALPLFALASVPALRRLAAAGLGAVAAGLAISSTLLIAVVAFTGPYASETLVNPVMEVNVPVLATGPVATVFDAFAPRPIGIALATMALAVLALRFVSGAWGARQVRPAMFVVLIAAAMAAHIIVASIPGSENARAVDEERTLLTRLIR